MQETTKSRLGIHYFPDDQHYGLADQQRWLPVMRQLGVRWTVLQAPANVAIPQTFIEGLLAKCIQPIVHLPLSLQSPPVVEEIAPILQAYATWGVQHVVLFDRPNLRSSWPNIGWTQRGLVERFLEVFLPLAKAAADAGLTPVFPPLEPGGDYWDTAFLRAALEEMVKRQEDLLLNKLALGAYAWTGNKDLDWGAGGPERWPSTLPYFTPEASQDQRGFRIFDWYNPISAAAAGRTLDILILGAGERVDGSLPSNKFKAIAATVEGQSVPENVLAANLWLLAADDRHPAAGQAFYRASGQPNAPAQDWLGSAAGGPAQPGNSAKSFRIDQGVSSKFKQMADNLRKKDVTMFEDGMIQQLKELASAGVEVHVHVNASGSITDVQPNPPSPTPDPDPTPDPQPDPDRYANYRKVSIPRERGYVTGLHPGSPDTGINRDVLLSKVFHNDVVEVKEIYKDGTRAYVRLADRGDLAEQHANIEDSHLGEIGVMDIIEGIELLPLS